MKKAFSLIELLVSLIIISLIISAFVPVISKKLKKQNLSLNSSSYTVTNQCKDDFSEDCELCYGKKSCLLCRKTCPLGSFIDIDSCSCKSCSSNCLKCSNNLQCEGCKEGYQIDASKTCSKCSGGYASNDGITCNECLAGTFTNTEGNSVCTPCEKGHFCKGGSHNELCPIGTYTDYKGKSVCSDCPPGTRTSQKGSTSSSLCIPCGAGTFCKGGTRWGSCPAHSTTPNGSGAVTCSCYGGYYYIDGADICADCPVNYYCPQYSNQKYPCPDGEFAPKNSESCQKLSDVASGSYVDSNGNIKICEEGYYCANGNKIPCPSGTAKATGLGSCKTCPSLHLGDGCYACTLTNCTGCNGILVNVKGTMHCQ